MTPKAIAQRLKGTSFAEVEDFGSDLLRRIALADPVSAGKPQLTACLGQWTKRFTPADHDEPRSL